MSIKKLKTQFNNLNKTQQTFVKYIMIIKVIVLIVAVAVFILAWKYLIK